MCMQFSSTELWKLYLSDFQWFSNHHNNNPNPPLLQTKFLLKGILIKFHAKCQMSLRVFHGAKSKPHLSSSSSSSFQLSFSYSSLVIISVDSTTSNIAGTKPQHTENAKIFQGIWYGLHLNTLRENVMACYVFLLFFSLLFYCHRHRVTGILDILV